MKLLEHERHFPFQLLLVKMQLYMTTLFTANQILIPYKKINHFSDS